MEQENETKEYEFWAEPRKNGHSFYLKVPQVFIKNNFIPLDKPVKVKVTRPWCNLVRPFGFVNN